ncbi:MAG: hypothetical protein AAF597_11480 [Bacteroidota bacterium]
MGQIFKLIGVVSVAGLLFGERLFNAIHDRYEYSLDRLRGGDIRFDFRRGKVVGLLDIRLFIKQLFGITLTLTGVELTFRQNNILLGVLDHVELVNLPHATTTEVPLTLVIPAGPFLERLRQITEPGNLSSAIAPLEISGRLYLSNGVSLPVRRSLNFLSIE